MNLKNTTSELSFFCAYVLWLSTDILSTSTYYEMINFHDLFKFVNIVSVSLLMIKIIYDNTYSSKKIIIALGIFAVVLEVVASQSQSDLRVMLLMTFLFIFTAGNIRHEKIIKVTLNINIVMMLFILSSYGLGVLGKDYLLNSDGTQRWYLGYTYTSFSGNYFFHMILMYVYLKKDKIRSIVLGIILLSNYALFVLTDTKAIYGEIIILVIAVYMSRFIKKPLKDIPLYNAVVKYGMPFLAALTILLTINYNASNEIFYMADQFLAGRITLGNVAYHQYGITIFGQAVQWITGKSGRESGTYLFVDCSYLNIALSYGLITLVLICVGFVRLGKKAVENNQIYLSIALVFLALHSATDPQLLDLAYDPFLLMLGVYINPPPRKKL